MNVPRGAWVEQVMGMPVSVHLRGVTLPPWRPAFLDEVFAELHRIDALMSTYRPDSQISRLAAGELTVAECDPLIGEVLELCEQARTKTGGAFDPLLPAPGGDYLLDPSGLVKGWAVERVAHRIGECFDGDYYINAGGDIAVESRSGVAWRIGVEDPRPGGGLLGVLPLTGGGVATSGTAHRGAHIVDPRTGRPADGLLSVTVTGPSLTWVDVLATAAFACGPESFDWLAGLDSHAALLVHPDGTTAVTSAMATLIQPVSSAHQREDIR
ncbi:MAG: FAD:protein FMN transferase [Pseudonocardiales bacterium]|jgi:FAD:protein FMN transferase|nr:FAD:protein FMN transferase [Pseudonocardiales bacterium]MBV9651348.1 FAD:protein FMN transferase [Pseudonocardiales bacterium]